jgi:hypothetical protein
MPILTPIEPGWEVLWFKPDPVDTLPALCVRGDPAKFVDLNTPIHGYDLWHLRIGLYVSAKEQKTARVTMAGLTGSKGLIVKTLEDVNDDFTGDDLWTLCKGNVRGVDGRGWNVIRESRNSYFYADQGVDFGAN